MKIAVSSSGESKDSSVDSRFGRCPYFLVIDTDDMEYESIENTKREGMGGVGPQVVQMLADMDIDAVITGNVGPNAYRALESADISVYQADGNVGEAVNKLKEGGLQEIDGQTVRGHFGQGEGRR